MKVFLDTNIVVDALANRVPFDTSAKKLIFLSQVNEVDAWCGASQFTDIHYVLGRTEAGASEERLIAAIRAFRHKVRVCSLTEEDVDKALASGWKDFEDACVYSMASRLGVDYIITRNQSDFQKSFIPVTDCDGLFDVLAAQGLVYEEIPG